MRLVLVAALAAAMPVSADNPTFRIGVACDGPLPDTIQIEASRAGVTLLTLADLMEFCASRMPEKSRWKIRA